MIGPFRDEYRFLSNFYPSRFALAGAVYPTVEHYYQACKAVSREGWRKVMDCETPGQAKRAGRLIECRGDWDAVKKQFMLAGVLAKFAQNPDLGHQLTATGDVPLVEVNTWGDRYWGAEMVWGSLEGENWLGRVLMMTRDVLS